MKILLVNWSWYPTGGDWTYVNNVEALYRKNGHEIVGLSTLHEKNVTSPFPTYFIDAPDYKALNNNKSIINGVKAVRNSVVSAAALKMIDRILEEHEIQVAHLHNIHHYITPAIIWKLKKAGIKVIWSLHDYKIICPESLFISNGKICEKCMKGSFIQCTINKCKKNSFAASALASAEAYYYHKKGIYDKVDAYLCPSAFLKNKFISFGFDDERLHVSNLCYDIPLVDNFIQKNKQELPINHINSDYVFYVGRIEEVKGVRTLIEAVRGTGILLKIAGTGAAEEEMKAYVAREAIKNVEFLGFMDKDAVFRLTMQAKFSVCPSEWYENFPFSVIESFLFSKPVIGARIGGIPEMVLHGKTGLLFEPENVSDLREKIAQLWQDDQLVEEMGKHARKHIHEIVNFDTHWNKLHSIINNITANGN